MKKKERKKSARNVDDDGGALRALVVRSNDAWFQFQ